MKVHREVKTYDRERRLTKQKNKQVNALANLAKKVAAVGDDALLDEFETAAFLGVSVQWLRNRRVYGGSLPYAKIGQAVRYRLGDLKESTSSGTSSKQFRAAR